MGAINKVQILGRIGSDVELRTTTNGNQVCNLSIATNENIGGGRTHTEWHRVVCWGRTAEIAEQYLKKGSQCHIEGHIRTRKYTDKNGVEKYTTEIHAERLQLL